MESLNLNYLSPNADRKDFIELDKSSDGKHQTGTNGVQRILLTKDKKVEYIFFDNHIQAYVKSAMGYPAYYSVPSIEIDRPIKAVLMDLDGTSVKSEDFWIWIIQESTASLLGDPDFELEEEDMPHVSGHSVSEHLEYCIQKYCPDKTVEEARKYYFEHTHREMQAILDGNGRQDAFKPSPGLKDFLLELKSRQIKIGLVTSGLYEKAWPEILSAFRQLEMGDPKDFYDAIITAGFPMRNGEPGTLGELSPKPHPWLYAEVARVGLGLQPEERHHVIGLEDSGAGINSLRLAGFAPIGISDGNIEESGAKSLCYDYCHNFEEVVDIIEGSRE
ncbi:MAG TPA: HAD family phosphatase [bacterium]|nr:HAD family phosphatase [bacterium]